MKAIDMRPTVSPMKQHPDWGICHWDCDDLPWELVHIPTGIGCGDFRTRKQAVLAAREFTKQKRQS